MEDFLGGELKNEAAAAAAARNMETDGARWRSLSESFRASENAAPNVAVTVQTDQPLFPYGEEGSALRRFFRRCARRAVRWYVEPMVREQNRINRALLGEIETLRRRVEELEGK